MATSYERQDNLIAAFQKILDEWMLLRRVVEDWKRDNIPSPEIRKILDELPADQHLPDSHPYRRALRRSIQETESAINQVLQYPPPFNAGNLLAQEYAFRRATRRRNETSRNAMRALRERRREGTAPPPQPRPVMSREEHEEAYRKHMEAQRAKALPPAPTSTSTLTPQLPNEFLNLQDQPRASAESEFLGLDEGASEAEILRLEQERKEREEREAEELKGGFF